jgi:hypothetical protein
VPLSMASELDISSDMYNVLVKELDQLALILNETKKNREKIENGKRNNV